MHTKIKNNYFLKYSFILNFSKFTNSNIKRVYNYIIILVKNRILVKNKYKCTFHSSHECLTYFYKLHNTYFDMFMFIVFVLLLS